MLDRDSPTARSGNSLIHEDDGELTLHFNLPTIQSRMLKAEPERLVLDYTRTMMGFLLLQPKPQRIVMVGLGGGSLAKYCWRKLPDCDFIAIELSAEVIALRDKFKIPPDGPRFRILCGDGADYMRDDNAPADVLLIDGFEPDGQPARLCSTAFYDDCFDKLNVGGVLVVNLCADDTGYGSYIGRIGDSFAGKCLVVDAEDGDNKIVFAQKGNTFPPGLNELAERLRILEAVHAVDLDKTAQGMLQQAKKRRWGRREGKRKK
ncbi:transferase [Propionivibrio sp.]|uniref:spermine/spermidine synthase domain-containing protein n=1 Tax=Propionivibrio sp. TaxID=2212460 RepID=UPI0025FAF702|nr:transferase [Propionivibrio sp.]